MREAVIPQSLRQFVPYGEFPVRDEVGVQLVVCEGDRLVFRRRLPGWSEAMISTASDWAHWQICAGTGNATAPPPIQLLAALQGAALTSVAHPVTVVHLTIIVGQGILWSGWFSLQDGSVVGWGTDVTDEVDLVVRMELASYLAWASGHGDIADVLDQDAHEHAIGDIGDLLLVAGVLECPQVRRIRRLTSAECAAIAVAAAIRLSEAAPALFP